MARFCLLLSAVALLSPQAVFAQETESDKSPREKLEADPNDASALNTYIGNQFRSIVSSINDEQYDEAEKQLQETADFLAKLEPTEDDAKSLIQRFDLYEQSYRSRIEVARTPLDELQNNLKENPEDSEAFRNLLTKYSMQISPIMRSEPEKAEALVKDAQEFLASVEEANPDNEKVQQLISSSDRTFSTYMSRIENAKKQLALIGQEAPALGEHIQTWANGDPLTGDQLDGKVVLYDFWAVWCGPCIATFPHLKEWQAKYGQQGFQIVGITGYYNFKWDDEQDRAVRPAEDDGEVTPEEEQEMLNKFAEQHELTHPFAIQGEDATLSEHFAVTGIPTAALIDREGKIRMIKVGSGEENAAELGQMIETLINE